MMLLFCLLKDAIAYRLRGGGFVENIGNSIRRILWGLAVSSSYFLLNERTILVSIYIFVMSFASMFIPHGFAFNAGNRTQTWDDMPRITVYGGFSVPKWWPAYWLVDVKDRLSFFWQDVLGLLSVGTIRAFMVLMVIPTPCIYSFFVVILSHPLSYMAGQKMPFKFMRPTEYAELMIGASWAVAMAIA